MKKENVKKIHDSQYQNVPINGTTESTPTAETPGRQQTIGIIAFNIAYRVLHMSACSKHVISRKWSTYRENFTEGRATISLRTCLLDLTASQHASLL